MIEQDTSRHNRVKFPWGKVVEVHRVGAYEVWEYDEYEFKSGPIPKERKLSGRRLYHPFVNDKDTCHSFYSLDAALIGAISQSRTGGTGGVVYIARMLRIESDSAL